MEHVLPLKIIRKDGDIINAENLLTNDREQQILGEPVLTVVNGKATIIFDYGKEYYGGLRFITDIRTDNVRCFARVRFGESLSECCAELGEKNADNHHSIRDLTIELVHSGDFTCGNTGFRFVRIDFLTEDCKIEIKSIFATTLIYKNDNVIYCYKGEDVKIKQIFDTAKRTVDLCCQNGYVWDGIKRDRIVWIGDMYPEMIALTSIYGRVDVIENSLEFVKNTTPVNGWLNRFPTYSLWYLIILADYYKETGCIDFLRNQIDFVLRIIKQMDECVLIDGRLNYPSYFVDWPSRGTEDEIMGVRAINIIACKKTIEILKALELDFTVVQDILERLKIQEITVKKKKQILALKYFATGSLTREEIDFIMKDGIKGFSTFMSYFLLKTIAECVSPEVATEMMKEYFGAMIEKGASTFWEDFDIEWTYNACRIDELPKEGQKDLHGDSGAFCYVGFRHSLCHGWSSGIIKYIKDYCK